MNARMIRSLVVKDVRLFFKNRFYALITVIGLVAYIAVYFLLPGSVDETLSMGVYAPELPAQLTIDEEALAEEGLVIERAGSEEALRAAVLGEEVAFGVSFPEDLAAQAAAGAKPQVTVFVPATIPPEFQDAYRMLVEELIFLMAGQELDLVAEEEIIGPDVAGAPTAPRDRLLPLFAVTVLMMETLGLASLISAEVQTGTVRALLVTPLTVPGLFLGKGITGVALAFTETSLLLALTGGFGESPLLIAVAVLLGAVMVTGVAFLLGSIGKDLLSVMAWGVLVMIVLFIPALGVAVPGLASSWSQLIPSYHLVDTVYNVANLGAGWGDVAANLLWLAVWAVVFLWVGVIVLRRRFR